MSRPTTPPTGLRVYLLHQTIGGLLGIFWRSLHERNAIKIAFPGKKP